MTLHRAEGVKKYSSHYSYALHYKWLTRFYDPVVRWTCRESTFKSALIAQAHIEPGMRVLDVGCGTGTLAIMLKKAQPSAVVKALDGSENILSIAKSKADSEGVNISFVHGFSYELPFAAGEFDMVFTSFFFHHLNREDKLRTLKDVHRILKPSGKLHIADWGKQPNLFLRSAFLVVQMLDGFETTTDNIKGLLPEFIAQTGFENFAETRRVYTALGSVSLYSAIKL
ncbi:MAG: methyltransferase domain-containing protein [Deltaproteobacteria bacterium]|nr:methyltransferase domain-containing protein [Deltaproteobacteria bacterium]